MSLNQRIALAALLVCALAAPARGQISWAVAERPDDKIEALVSRLEPFLEPLPGLDQAAGAVLYHQILVKPDKGTSQRCENLILTIKDPAGMPEELMQPRQFGTDEVVSMSAFVRRGTEYRRLGAAEIKAVPGREEIGRSRFEIDWGELAEGDVVGWSLVTQRESPYSLVPIRLAQRIPIVMAALQVQSNGDFAYEFMSSGIPRKDTTQKKEEVTDGRAMLIKASANQRPSVESIPDELPWGSDYPWMALYLKEVRIDASNQFLLPGWAATGGWNQSVMALGSVAQQRAEDLQGMDIVLSTITTGKTTDREKAAAACAWVRDKFTLLEGEDYVSGGVRDLNDVIKSKEATKTEKVLLMGAILRKLEIPVTAALVRTADLGPVDRGWKHVSQFNELALRTVDEGAVTYWAPQCGECEPGTTPAEWAGAEVLTYEFASVEAAETYSEDLRKKAMVEGRVDLAKIQADMEAQPWSFFETISE